MLGMETEEILHFSTKILLFGTFMYLFGFLYGVICMIAFNYIYHYFMYFAFGLVALNPMDEIFLHEDPKNPCNIVGCFIYEKFEIEAFKNQVRTQGYKQFRTGAKIVKVLGKYYWKAMDLKERELKEPTYVQRIDGIHNEEQLADFMIKEQVKKIELDNAQHRNYLIPDYNETQSAYIFKFQHCFADGLACVNFMYGFQDEENQCVLPKIRGFTLMQKIMMAVLSPFSIIQSVNYVRNVPNDENWIHNPSKELTGVKKAAFSKDISLPAVKKKARELGVTINDLVMAITSMSIKRYLESKGDNKTSKIIIACPFSLRDPTPNPKNFKLENDFVSITVDLDLTLSLKEALAMNKKRMDELKKSLIPSGQYFFMKVASHLPSVFSKYLCEGVGQRHTMIFSNVPGPVTPYQITGKKAIKSMYMANGVGKLSVGMTVFSCVDIMKICFSGDIAEVPDPKEVISIFNENFDSVLESSKTD